MARPTPGATTSGFTRFAIASVTSLDIDPRCADAGISSESVFRQPAGTLLDWFTPYNWSFLNATDEDLGIQNAMPPMANAARAIPDW